MGGASFPEMTILGISCLYNFILIKKKVYLSEVKCLEQCEGITCGHTDLIIFNFGHV